MLKRDDPRLIDFRVEAEEALWDAVWKLVNDGLGTDTAIEKVISQIRRAVSGFDEPPYQLPELNAYGSLPATHCCTMEEIERRFGQSTERRQELIVHLREVVQLGRQVDAIRLIVGGSFVTS